ncbi:MAG TPA: hypothetical protein VF396_04865 [Bradyrhizobium sp.]
MLIDSPQGATQRFRRRPLLGFDESNEEAGWDFPGETPQQHGRNTRTKMTEHGWKYKDARRRPLKRLETHQTLGHKRLENLIPERKAR